MTGLTASQRTKRGEAGSQFSSKRKGNRTAQLAYLSPNMEEKNTPLRHGETNHRKKTTVGGRNGGQQKNLTAFGKGKTHRNWCDAPGWPKKAVGLGARGGDSLAILVDLKRWAICCSVKEKGCCSEVGGLSSAEWLLIGGKCALNFSRLSCKKNIAESYKLPAQSPWGGRGRRLVHKNLHSLNVEGNQCQRVAP